MSSKVTHPCFEISSTLILTWQNISYTVAKKINNHSWKIFVGLQQIKREQLLNEGEVGFSRIRNNYNTYIVDCWNFAVTGRARAGVLLPILGPSGCGKTTLLAALSHRLKGEITGNILLNGKSTSAEDMFKMSGFVPLKELAVESLTVQEHMEFMARMKMDKRVPTIHRRSRIDILLIELGLVKCKDWKLSTLSGGERKRVSLAVQLLTEPSILFCDEPTTGLDSYSATTVMKILRDVANKGKIVICSLHQPASGTLDFCDEVLVMSLGKVVFQGKSADAIDFFQSVGLHCPPAFNNADYYISQVSVPRGKEVYSYKKMNLICDEFNRSRHAQDIIFEIEQTYTSKTDILPATFSEISKTNSERKKVCISIQIVWLVWRTLLDYKKNFRIILLRFLLYMFTGLLICTPYVNIMKTLGQESIQNIQGLMYLVVIETVFNFNYSVYYTIPRKLPIFLRDMASNVYSPLSYYISQLIVLLPGTLFQPFAFCALVFFVTGLNGELQGFTYFVIPIMFAASSATAVGCLMSAAFKSIDTAFLLSVPFDFVTLVFCGIYLQLKNLSPWIAWIKYGSQFYCGLEAISLSQWEQIEHIDCSSDVDVPCISSGLGVLEKYGYQPGHYYTDLMGLLAIFLVSHFGGFLAISYRSRKEVIY